MLDEDESLFFQDEQQPKSSFTSSDIINPSTRFVDEASVFDGFGKHDQAIDALKKAVEIEKHEKEKVRLKILLSQYTNKKGTISLDDIIKEYPSFHAQASFDPDNTISSLISSKLPKSDLKLNQINSKQEEKEFDMFADILVLNENQIIENFNNSSKNSEMKVTPKSTNIFDDLPSLETTVDVRKEIIQESTPKADSSSDNQFSWSSSSSNPFDDTEKILSALKQDAEIIDKANEEEAMDDMQKFLKEFGGILGDIKSQEKQQFAESSKSASLPIQEEKIEPSPLVAQPLEQLKPVEPPKPVEPAKPTTYKVWANWIVDINGKQTFRNHFVTLKNPWGTAAAGEELYMGLSKVSKGPDGKTYPWVLVSVFPLQK